MDVNIDKAIFNIVSPCKNKGKEILTSSFLNSCQVKNTLQLAVQHIVISGEINVPKWVINLGTIPAAQFDTLFIPRLAQAFAERLSCGQVPIAVQQEVAVVASNAIGSGVSLNGYHLDGEGLIQLARCCLISQAFKALFQNSPTYQLQQLLKLLLEGARQSPKMLPVSWYDRVTPSRLSIAAVLYLLKSQRGHDWMMHQHSPTASQVSCWVKSIDQGEIPPEQVAQLLTGNRPFDSILTRQSAYPALVVMRWLLPLWRQPAVRKVIHRLKGGQGVQRLDVYLSRCLQLQDDDFMQKNKMSHIPEQVALQQDNAVLSPVNWALTASPQVRLPQDNFMLPEVDGIRSVSPQVRLPQDNFMLSEVNEIRLASPQVRLSQDNTVLSQGKGGLSNVQRAALLWNNDTLPKSEEMLTTFRGTMPSRRGAISSTNEPCSSSQDISNAGLLLLWPILPQLFSLLGLWEEERLISDAARWQAVYGLDRLVWGEVNSEDERLTLNQVLCGVSCSIHVSPTASLSLAQQQQIDGWLTAIGQQFVGWQKLSLTDIRQLFLQRAGKICMEGTVPQISVRPEPYDFILRDWPWPMALASFPWTEQSLTIVWPLNGFIG
jgi:hypothetical protein